MQRSEILFGWRYKELLQNAFASTLWQYSRQTFVNWTTDDGPRTIHKLRKLSTESEREGKLL